MARAYSPSEILNIKKKDFAFSGEWRDAFGSPEQSGVWLIWGNSGNGKTSFVMQLCRELSRFGRVVYNTLEEGVSSKVMQDAIKRFGLNELDGRLQFVSESTDELTKRLSKRRSPDFAIIDSFQNAGISYKRYLDMKAMNRGKLIVFVSRASGKMPMGRAAESVMYDADLKIWVEGYRAFSKGRYIGKSGFMDIWHNGAMEYWGER